MSMNDQNKALYFPVLIAVVLFAVVLLRTAWLCDDAFITFRTIDNFQNGYGLNWNVAERVQAFTHPLWMMLLAVGSYGSDIPLACIALGLLVSLAVVCVFAFGVARSAAEALVGIAALVSSKAFIDYSTSGLENPLSHLFVAWFAWVYFSQVWNLRTFSFLSLIAGLAALNRMDTILVFLPALMYVGCRLPKKQAMIRFGVGMLPLILWMVFSLLYYGYPLPNTAYAKLGTGPERLGLVLQGLVYVKHTLINDPITPLILLLAIAAAFFYREKKKYPLLAGMMLYLAYMIWIGGDFMQGRFFSVPVMIAVILHTYNRFERFSWKSTLSMVMLIGIGLLAPRPNLISGSQLGSVSSNVEDTGIADERAFFFHTNGLLNYEWKKGFTEHQFAQYGMEMKKQERKVVMQGPVGMMGYYAGPEVHIVDHYGVCDPLLAHLPFDGDPRWRVGHFNRQVPQGYIQTLLKEENHFYNPNVALFYEKVQWLTRKPLFSWQRMVEIVKMNLGWYNHLLDSPYTIPVPERRIPIQKMQVYVKNRSPSNGPNIQEIDEEGLQIDLVKKSHAKIVEIAVDHDDVYQLVWVLQGKPNGSRMLQNTSIFVDEGMMVKKPRTPKAALDRGFDALRLFPVQGAGEYRVGHIYLIERELPESES